MSHWRTPLLLVVILATAASARLFHLNFYCYYFDEAWNDELSTGRGSLHIRLPNDVIHENVPKPTSLIGAAPWYAIWTHMDYVTHPPLYLIVLRWWRDLFGESPIVSRACSAILSTLAILFLFDVGRLLHGTSTAMWACLIMALAGAQVQLAREVRPYALELLMSMAALSALVRIEKLGRSMPRLIALGACVLGMVLTHYFAAPAALAMGVYALIRLRGSARRDAMIALIIAGLVFAIAWGPFFLQQRNAFSAAVDTWLREDLDGRLLRNLTRFAAVPLRLLMTPPQGAFPGGYVAVVALFIPFAMLKRRPEMLLWCLWLCGTIFFVAAMDLIRGTYQLAFIRYALIGGPAIYMSLSAVLANSNRAWLRHIVPACIALSCLGALPETYDIVEPEYRQLASYLDNNVQPTDVVVFYVEPADYWFVNAMYLNTCYYTRSYPWPFMMTTHVPDAAMSDRLKQASAIWFVVSMDSRMDGQTFMPGATVDGYQHFPYLCQCFRLTPDAKTAHRPVVQPRPLWELR
jgi:4-amino-4-deoxy-L-arabinose transferase-like glycosyltransferase